MEKTVENKKSRLSVINLLFLVLFCTSLINAILNYSNSFGTFIAAALLLLLIGSILSTMVSRYSVIIMKITITMTALSLYLALGAGLLHYSGEGGQMQDYQKGAQFSYGIQLHSGLSIPGSRGDYVLPLGQEGMALISDETVQMPNYKGKGYSYGLELTFKVTEDRASLPRKLVVIYRGFKIVPMVNIIEMSWPKYSPAAQLITAVHIA